MRRLYASSQPCLLFSPKIEAKIIVEPGPPGQVICRVAMEQDATLIVMGSRGEGTVRRTILGSVSDYVIHHTHIPVLVVPREQDKPS